MFSAPVFNSFANHPGLAAPAPTAKLLNKAHHGDRRLITPSEVLQCAEELASLIKLADKLHEECRRWRRHEREGARVTPISFAAALTPIAAPNLKVDIFPDLAAFTQHAPTGESQELSEPLVVEESAVPLVFPKQIVLGGPWIELDRFTEYEGALVALTLENGSSVFKRIGAALPGDLSHLRQFESVGGLGSSEILSLGKAQPGISSVLEARSIIGVLYRS